MTIPKAAISAADKVKLCSLNYSNEDLWPVKVYAAINLFLWHIDVFNSSNNPVPDFITIMEATCNLLSKTGRNIKNNKFQFNAKSSSIVSNDIGKIYSDASFRLTDHEYFKKSQDRLRMRLEANDIDLTDLFSNKIILDAGCGSGNYTMGIAKMGARSIYGIDIGNGNIAFARKKASQFAYGKSIKYLLGSADAIPFKNESIDLIWSNSVVHVTGNYERCIYEAARVLKPNGLLYLYVDGHMGLFELLVNTLLILLKGVPSAFTQHYLMMLGIDHGRIQWMMACFYVPYERKCQNEVERLLKCAGFTKLRKLSRGLPEDQNEKLINNAPFASIKYGEGELKYLATKAVNK